MFKSFNGNPPGKHRLWISCCALLASGAGLAWACGPFFPNSLLMSGDHGLLSAPVADFYHELDRLKKPADPKLRAVNPPEDDPARQTADRGQQDLENALQARPKAGAKALLAAYASYRKAVVDAKPATAPAGLPEEFDRYLQGAEAYRAGRFDQAREHWRQLLRLPADQRPYRSTWAAFMIGKACLKTQEPQRAVAWFERTRDLARQGFKDSLGLAASSFGWEGRAALDARQYDRAISLYRIQQQTGDGSAEASLRSAVSQLLESGDKVQLDRAARRQDIRDVVTAYVISRGAVAYEGLQNESAERWLAAVEGAANVDAAGASRLAWAAYQAGQMGTAERWLNVADPNDPVTHWVKAKLLMREGEIQEAAAALARSIRSWPERVAWENSTWWQRSEAHEAGIDPRAETLGELGVLTLSRGDYQSALQLLLASKYYDHDAAYIAERVLTLNELKDFVDQHYPAAAVKAEAQRLEALHANDPSLRWRYSGYAMDNTPKDVRHLLAKRLTRAGRWKEARPYFPEKYRPRLDAYVTAIRAGHDRARTKRQRAESLWEAARIARFEGMELMGTYLEPDFWWGGFQWPQTVAVRTGTHPYHRSIEDWRIAPPSEDEKRRVAAHAIQPNKRFHYRYVAAEHAWQAAELLPDQNDRTAMLLCEAGSWLKAKDPDAADRFYKALVNRCGTTDLGRKADERRWFPSMDPPTP